MIDVDYSMLSFDSEGLIPAVIQDEHSNRVIMFAWMNRESLKLTVETGETVFFSRSRRELWHKGATSGNTQTVSSIAFDCDADVLLVKVHANGPACHKGSDSCFDSGEIRLS